MNILLEGLYLGASLIIAIGAQNAYVMRQGIKREFVFINAFICSLIDIILITLGVLGLGIIINGNKIFLIIATIFGAIFLFIYGLRSLFSALKPKVLNDIETVENTNLLLKNILTIISLSLLNPHVYLDTVILLGGIGARYPLNQQTSFIIGASLASIIWFFSLSFGSRILTPLFKKKITWRILDILIGIIMLYISYSLVKFLINNKNL